MNYINKLNSEIMVVLFLAVFIVACLLIDIVVQYVKRRKSRVTAVAPISFKVFNELSVSIPNGLYFDKTHTWAFMEKNGFVKIGIDDFILHVTGPLTKVEMREKGEMVKKGDPALSIIQNGKKLTMNSPISGTVISHNENIIKDSSIVNSSPYERGWIYTIEPLSWIRDTKFMLMADKYKEWLRNEFTRLKDFLSVSVMIKTGGYIPAILQDGGELKEHFLTELGPEVWEDFQTKFINTSK